MKSTVLQQSLCAGMIIVPETIDQMLNIIGSEDFNDRMKHLAYQKLADDYNLQAAQVELLLKNSNN